MPSSQPPSQFLLLSQPRTGCHLLERMLSRQSSIHTYLWHPFGSLPRYPHEWLKIEPLAQVPATLEEKHKSRMERGVKEWQAKLEMAQREEKALYVHFHPLFTMQSNEIFRYVTTAPNATEQIPRENPTLIPDSVLLRPGTVPVFTIRNPRLQVPSVYRMVLNVFPGPSYANCLAGAAGRWTRLLYDWYAAQGIHPIVVDADDYMSSVAFVRHLCEVTGLDPGEVLTRWEKEESAGREPTTYDAVQETLLASQGPEARRAAKNVDLKEEERRWDEVFGSDRAQMLREIVKSVSPDYEYLRRRRLMLPSAKL